MRGSLCADDTGTGKTIQALALIAERLDNAPSTLVVIKSSTLASWKGAIEKFTPNLKVQVQSSDKASEFDYF
jgi:SNF2 family DNA or RNA helicase